MRQDTSLAAAFLSIDLGALRDNYRLLARRVGPAACAAVVKADAYGLGIARVAPVLAEAGCRQFFVAQVGEGVSLRAILGPGPSIGILNGTTPGSEAACAASDLVPVLNDSAQLDAWTRLARHLGRRLPAILQVDSGMTRFGFDPAEALALFDEPDAFVGLTLTLVMSHLACADTPEHPANAAQLAAFSAAATAAATRTPARTRTSLQLGSVRRTVMVGSSASLGGRLRGAQGPQTVRLQRRTGAGWTTVARDRTTAAGAFRLSYRPPTTGTLSLRVRYAGNRAHRRVTRSAGRVNVYRRAFASWYGPGLYGNKLGCGGTLTAGTLGVAHKTLPCGTEVTLKHGSRTVRVPVVDRGPYVGGRDFDLTAATKAKLGFGSTGTVLSTK